ncbi:MAG TPA: hypothetical protein VFO80_08625 [Sphingomonas sp.]|nr:hypothetical protein [Sphingomonas sp.]
MQDVVIDGVARDLRHLADFVVPIPGKGKEGADLRVKISLGLHTISTGCSEGQHNLRDENGKPRQFCEDRYAFSLGLHELARRMIEQNYFCWESSDRNRSINYAVIDVAPGRIRTVPDGRHQVVFFYLYPCKGADADVNLAITSCHSRDVRLSRVSRRYNLQTLLRTCLYSGKRIP